VSGESRELYVYYRVAQADVQAAQQTVRAFQERLRELHPGLVARLLQRSEERAEGVTLMEVYAFDDGQRRVIDPGLRLHIEEAAAALTPLLSSPRHNEAFDPLD